MFTSADERVEPGPVTEVNVAHKSMLLECFEVAVHRGQVELRTGGDAVGRGRAVRREQRFEHEPARGREPQAACSQGIDGGREILELEPLSVGRLGHDGEISLTWEGSPRW